MGIIRPATPGFLVTLAATAILAVVSFCVPLFKTVYFLKANISVNGANGSITFGTLGYCIEIGELINCSKPTVGYELDINGLVGNKLPVKIPNVVVKWLTYCLILHIVAFGLAGASAIFGLLAHVREMSMTCCSSCISGFAAAVALLAFIFDISIFFAAKSRINAIGSAQLGNATWLTLVAWVLLFFSSTFFTLGRCCIAKRSRGNSGKGSKDTDGAEHMRLEAVRAEAERKARQNKAEQGLPAFPEYQPLTGYVDGDKVYNENPYRDDNANPAYGGRPAGNAGYAGGGYARAPAGTRAVDEYYNPSRTEPTSPTIRHQQATSTYSDSNTSYNPQNLAAGGPTRTATRQGSGYAPSQYTASVYTTHTQSTSPPPAMPSNPYLAAGTQQYGHGAGGSSYHTASHTQQPTNYSAYNDPYDYQQRNQYTTTPPAQTAYQQPSPAAYAAPTPTNYYSAAPTHQQTLPPVQERSYTLGGGGSYDYDYTGTSAAGALPLPGETQAYSQPQQQHYDTSYYAPPAALAPINANTASHTSSSQQQSPIKGPRSQNSLSVRNHDDAPPIYEAGASGVQGNWGKPTAL